MASSESSACHHLIADHWSFIIHAMSANLPTGRRARSAAAKDQRRSSILEAVRTLFSRQTYADVTISQVARQANVAKGTVYLYFRNKEELFLALMAEQVNTWLTELRQELDALSPPLSADALATLLTGLITDRHMLARLLVLLHGVLEENLPDETARRFKLELRDAVLLTGKRLEDCFPALGPGGGPRLLLHLNALITGLYPAAHPAPRIAELLDDPELALFRIDFAAELERILVVWLRGIESDQATA